MKPRPLWMKIIGNLDIAVAASMLIILITVTFLGVFMRYLVNRPFSWQEEVQLACMVWIVFAGGGAAFRMGNHVAIEMVVDLFPKTVQRIIEYFIGLVVTVVLLYLTWQSFAFLEVFIRTGRSTSMLGIPFSLIYGIAPVSFILMIINYFYSLITGTKSEAKEAISSE